MLILTDFVVMLTGVTLVKPVGCYSFVFLFWNDHSFDGNVFVSLQPAHATWCFSAAFS
jgi:hypothetical protein